MRGGSGVVLLQRSLTYARDSSVAHSKERRLRRQIALEAARLMAGAGKQDFLAAKRKAAARLGVSESRFMPRNTEIKAALEEYQNLFQSTTHPNHIRALRKTALDAMYFFSAFEPRLVGGVLEGIANEHSDITLHLFSDTAEDVAVFLMEERIPFDTADRRVRVMPDQYEEYPAFQFLAGDHRVELVVFPVNGLRQAPFSPVDGRPMRRGSVAAVEKMLDGAGSP